MSIVKAYKRRTYIVKKHLQYRFITWVAGTVVIAVGVMLLDVFISMNRRAQEVGLTIQVSDLYNPADPFTLLKLSIYVIGVVYASLLLSHRVAGPIYRFERSADEVAQGDLTHKVFLRQRDELVELRDSFNAMVDSLRGKVAGDVACAFRARKQLEDLLQDATLPQPVLEKIRRAVGDIGRVGKDFKI